MVRLFVIRDVVYDIKRHSKWHNDTENGNLQGGL